jgi:hypothetical protein
MRAIKGEKTKINLNLQKLLEQEHTGTHCNGLTEKHILVILCRNIWFGKLY